ncbi:hypothetical protein KRX57_06310 [Weeksellaceae bacterium TAE3-ERU29]|nr:hypothetical protein [Weeksellaceae bacterium TAE3-ERU29]
MLHRIFYRLKYTFSSGLLGGIILLFFAEWKKLGIWLIVVGATLYFICEWLERKTKPKQTYDADENGHAKPKYR